MVNEIGTDFNESNDKRIIVGTNLSTFSILCMLVQADPDGKKCTKPIGCNAQSFISSSVFQVLFLCRYNLVRSHL